MAGRVMNQSKRLVTYSPSVKVIMQHLRALSSGDKRLPPSNQFEFDFEEMVDENKLCLIPKDKQLFPLPGNIGFSKRVPVKKKAPPKSDLFSVQLASDRHKQAIFQAIISDKQEAEAEKINQSCAVNMLECVAQECPPLIVLEFVDLFPEYDITSSPFTVITLSQKTTKDMSEWSTEVETERENLMQNFVLIAEKICGKLTEAGFWAEFIDPYSGTPFLGAHTNTTMFETDERYNHFGFNIEDLGCCKVIKHHLWGSHVFVGCLFTNAPTDDPTLKLLLEPLKK